MFRKLFVLIIITLMLVSVFPTSAFAALANGTYDLSEFGNDSEIVIADNNVVTITNTQGNTYTNIQIKVHQGASLTLQNVKIDNTGVDGTDNNHWSGTYPIYLYDNTELLLVGHSTIIGGSNASGIKCQPGSHVSISGAGSLYVEGGSGRKGIEGVDLTISGGTIDAKGGLGGSGIGGTSYLTISGGTVTATGQGGEPGINGGGGYAGVECTITGGTVTAYGGSNGGAGIGSRSTRKIYDINIQGGTVYAYGGKGAAGIGGGNQDDTLNYDAGEGVITISGGSVFAKGSEYAAGIGAGNGAVDGGTINLEGGIVRVQGGEDSHRDIGKSFTDGTDYTITVSENFVGVFYSNSIIINDPITTYGIANSNSDSYKDGKVYGVPMPQDWTQPYHYYINTNLLYDLAYDINGGSGTISEASTQLKGTTTIIEDGTSLVNGAEIFYKWNTQADGEGIDYLPDDEFAFQESTTLYAMYKDPFAQGEGTQADPYGISTPEQLSAVRDYTDSHFIMLNDIDMSTATSEGGVYWNDGAGWKPIQDFLGTFNGANFKILGLNIYRTEQDNVGLFATTDAGSIIQNVQMMNYAITGNNNTGSVVGYSIGKIENCCSEGVLSGYMYVGGIAGYNSNDILGCTNSGEISGYKAIGGICGKLDGLSSSVSEATNTGDITGEVNAVGGIVGYNTNGLVQLSYNTGLSAADYYVGGIVGNSSGTIDRCYNAGRVEGDNNPGCSGGGIAGRTSGGIVSNCFNVGETNIYDGYGTIVGYVWGETHIRYCYNANYKRAYATGYNERGTVTSYYFFYEGDEYSGADAKTRQELCQQATFENYDFTDVWEIIEGERFPVLKEVPFTYADSISLPESLLLTVNEYQTLTAIASPSEATNHMVIWSSSDTGIASIGIEGKVHAKSPGEVTLIATSIDGGLTDTCILTVIQPVAGVTLNESIISLDVENTTTLTATISPENATDKNVTWSSDNVTVATVSEGVVTAVSAGTATISVTTSDGGYTDTCAVTVTQPVTGVSLDESTITLAPSNTYTITETVEPANASNKNVTWSSNNESIATVSNGVITGVSSGATTITVTTEDGSFTDTCVVTVTQPVTGVSLEWSTLTVYAETESMPLISTVYPENATNKSLTWSSSNSSVAKVLSDGLVIPLSNGTATIKVTTEDGGFTATCVVTVKERKIESNVYSMDNEYITGIAVNTSVAQLKANLLTESRHIKIYNAAGAEYTGNTVATGMKIKFYLEGDLADELTIIISGDANGDGKISITDYTLARLDILGLKELAQIGALAADINGDGKVSITDYTLMRLDILGLKKIH